MVELSAATNASNPPSTDTAKTIATIALSPIDDLNLLKQISAFVGKNQYRFIAKP
jgi:hypothetical protein